MGLEASAGRRGGVAIVVAPVATLIACLVLFFNVVRCLARSIPVTLPTSLASLTCCVILSVMRWLHARTPDDPDAPPYCHTGESVQSRTSLASHSSPVCPTTTNQSKGAANMR